MQDERWICTRVLGETHCFWDVRACGVPQTQREQDFKSSHCVSPCLTMHASVQDELGRPCSEPSHLLRLYMRKYRTLWELKPLCIHTKHQYMRKIICEGSSALIRQCLPSKSKLVTSKPYAAFPSPIRLLLARPRTQDTGLGKELRKMLPAAGTLCSGVQAGPRCFTSCHTNQPQLRSGLLGSPLSHIQCRSLSGSPLHHQSRMLSQRRRPIQTTMMAAKGKLQ